MPRPGPQPKATGDAAAWHPSPHARMSHVEHADAVSVDVAHPTQQSGAWPPWQEMVVVGHQAVGVDLDRFQLQEPSQDLGKQASILIVAPPQKVCIRATPIGLTW